MTTYDQPTKAPTRKIGAVALGGGVASVLMGVLAMFYPEVYERVPAGMEGGIATIAGFALGYFVRDRV